MDRKYQVFISSTYEDLKEQRDAVVKAVLKMGHLPVGMEMFNAADQQQWEIIKRHINNSDYYVLIVANRYGSIGPAGISYTEQEYEYATEKGVPCLGFLLQKGTAWPDTMMETGPAKKKLDIFKKKVGGRPVNFWDNTDKLALQVYASLSEAITLNVRPGWVRATEAASPQVAEELARLSKENTELRMQVLQSQTSDEFAEIKVAFEREKYEIEVHGVSSSISLDKLFEIICDEPKGVHEYELFVKLVESLGETKLYGLDPRPIRKPLEELVFLGLLLPDRHETGASTWYVTEMGKRFYTKQKYSVHS